MDPIEAVKAKFADQVLSVGTHAGQAWVDVKRDRIVDILKMLRDECAFDMLTDLTAVDYLNQGMPERYCVVYQMYSFKDNVRARVKAWVPEGDPAIESVSALFRAAPWAEREVWDLFGITFKQHPGLKRLVLPETYQGHPLRKDYPLTGHGERMDFPEVRAMTEPRRTTMSVEEETEGDLGTKRMIVNFGPQHPATHGTLRNIIELDGERVMKLEPEIGFLHSGFEKISEYRTYNQTVTVTDRMNYLSPLCNNVGFSLAVEEMMGIKVTPRCAAIRVALCELSRIADHILSVGLQAMDLGAFTVMLWTFIEREKLYDIFENVTGARLTTSYTRVGGLLRDIPADFEDMVRKFMGKCSTTIDEIEAVLNGNRIFLDRTQGVSPVPRDVAISFGLSGPLLRAAGVPYDVRKARPYLGYENYQFDLITEENGDAWCRYRVRIREMRESLKIIDQVLKAMPPGPIYVDDPRIVIPPKTAINTPGGGMEGLIYHFKNYMMGHGMCPPKGEVYSCTEAPNGELGYYLVSDGTQRPYRWRVRPPSLYNYQAFPYMTEGGLLSDVVAVMSSLNIIAGELDR